MPADKRSFPSVWARPARQERSKLTREQIVAGALQLLDTEGIEALSMRRLGAQLGAGATSLYWHVANRDELIELVIDQVYGELEVPDPDRAGDWQAAARRFAHSLRSTTLRHRWLVSVLDHMVAAFLGPNLADATERMLAVLEKGGFPLREAERALNAVAAYASGVAMSEAAWHGWLARHGQTQKDWVDEAVRVAEGASDSHSRLQKLVAVYQDTDPQKAMDEDFEYGLERLLDGLQARLDRRRRKAR